MAPLQPDIDRLPFDLVQDLGQVELVVFDFDGVFTDNLVYVSQDGVESVVCWRSDGLGISKIKKLGMPVWVISTEKNHVVEARCRKLEIDFVKGCDDKLAALKSLTKRYGCSLHNVVYTGNDINDTACLEAVGIPIVVEDSHPEVIPKARYVTLNSGGQGAVREVCDLIVSAINRKNME